MLDEIIWLLHIHSAVVEIDEKKTLNLIRLLSVRQDHVVDWDKVEGIECSLA